MALTQDKMDSLSKSLFLPMVLVMDAWVFQYLVSIYYSRRREFRVCMLLVASFLVFSTQLYIDDDIVVLMAMNDISETSLQLTFIIQITMIGRAVSVKVKVRSIVWFTNVAELLIILNWLNVVTCILDAAGILDIEGFRVARDILETLSFVFVFLFRFFYIALSMGLRAVAAERKMEFVVYAILIIHVYPFTILEDVTGVLWEFPQAICHRVLMITCILLNLQNKGRSKNSRNAYTAKSNRDSATRPAARPRNRGLLGKMLARRAIPGKSPPNMQSTAKVAVSGV